MRMLQEKLLAERGSYAFRAEIYVFMSIGYDVVVHRKNWVKSGADFCHVL